MSKLIFILTALTISFSAFATPTEEQPDRNEELYNTEDGIGLKGYDPVSYFPEGGGEALEGLNEFEFEYGGVVYFFSSEENLETFAENPTKYEPTYGGWCAWAMANESYANINPELFTINGNRLHFFISRGAKNRFDRDLESRESDADEFWESESEETPRL